MSIKNLPGRVKFRHTDQTLTSNISLLGIHGLANRFGLLQDIGRDLPSYQSNRAFSDFKYSYLQILSHAAGGVGIEDTRKISADLPLGRMLFPDQAAHFDAHPDRAESYFPAPNTLGDWYRNATFMHAVRARKRNRQFCREVINKSNRTKLHIDIDSKIHASTNKSAQKTRKGYTGYTPLYGTIPELKLVLDPFFRPGNIPPAKHNPSMTRTILRWINSTQLERADITIDAAGCQVEVMKEVYQANQSSDQQIYIYTRPSKPDQKIPDKMFKSINKAGAEWKPIKIDYKNDRKKYRYPTEEEKKRQEENDLPPTEILDTDYTLSSPYDSWTGRLVMIRKPVEGNSSQKSFTYGYRYYPVLTNDYESDPIDIPGKYNQRGAGEDTISEIVQGGEAERFPCAEDEGNALYLVLCAIGHNLDQVMKMVTDQTFRGRQTQPEKERKTPLDNTRLQESKTTSKPLHQETLKLLAENAETKTSWLQFTIPKFRHLLLSIPAKITGESRYSIVNFSSYDPFGRLLEEVIRACWDNTPLVPSGEPP